MVSPSKQENAQNSDKYTLSKKGSKSATLKAVKAKIERNQPKPFSNKIVYLDLKNRKESANLETSLKSLGAVVAVFLDTTVTHLVSDRLIVGPCGSSTVLSPAASVSPYAHLSPNTSERSSLPRSRGAAMLEKVAGYSGTAYVDPITLAFQWQIPVLNVAKIWAEIAKAESQRKVSKVKSKPSGFIKVQSTSENWKPDVLKIEKWPALDLDSTTGSPFLWNNGQGVNLSKKRETMTRRPYKNSVNNEDDTTDASIGGGKSSLLCNGHITSPTRHNSHEYLRVQCNGLSGTSLRTSKLLSPSGSDVLPLPSQRRSTRRASASWCGSTRELSQLSPALSSFSPPISPDSELGVTLRPKGTLWLPVALIGTTAEEHGNSIRRRRGGSDDDKPRKKKLSPEEKLLQDNKEYFKMEVLNTKLRSSDLNQKPQHQPTNNINNIIIKKVRKGGRWVRTKECEDSVDYEALIVENKIMKVNGVQQKKKKKHRRSALMNLCDEAESFMFGESSRQSASVPSISEGEEDGESVSCDEVQTRRKRRSHAEAFIHDNQDYYKFETTGSRLRSHGSSEHDASNNVECLGSRLHSRSCDDDAKDGLFSFEAAPVQEPWYDVFKRQDEGREMHFPIFSDPANQLFQLPYEMPQLPAMLLCPNPADYYVKRRQRLAQILAQNHPRKSPRCHASTLAILSSLKKKKRRSSQSIGGESPTKDDPLVQLGLVDSSIDEELTFLDPVDLESPTNSRRKKTEDRCTLRPASVVPIERNPIDVIDLVTTGFNSISMTPDEVPPVRLRGPRGKRKARRFNKTGWDKVRTRKIQKVSRLGGGIAAENIVTSPRRSPPAVVSPCVVRVRKLSLSHNARVCRKLVLTRKRRRASKDYAWTTKR